MVGNFYQMYNTVLLTLVQFKIKNIFVCKVTSKLAFAFRDPCFHKGDLKDYFLIKKMYIYFYVKFVTKVDTLVTNIT